MLKPGHSLKFALLPDGQDPDDLLKQAGPEAVRDVIRAARPLADVLWSREAGEARTETPDGRAIFEIRLSRLIGEIGDLTVRKYYAEDMRRRMAEHLAPVGSGMLRKTANGFAMPRPMVSARRRPRARPEPHDFALPPSEGLRASPLARGPGHREQERRERSILLAAIDHPELVPDFLTDLADIEIGSRELDSLRRELIDMAALGEGLDGAALKNHLNERGFGPLVARLESQALRLNEWYLSSGAASADTRMGLQQMIALHRKSVTLNRELKAAEAQFAADPSEGNFAALNHVRDELTSHTGFEAQIEGFGEASGRPVNVIS